jgi:hypothetical protein
MKKRGFPRLEFEHDCTNLSAQMSYDGRARRNEDEKMNPARKAPTSSGDIAALLIAVLMLSSVAIYNRYPFVWPDTGGYLAVVNLTFRSIFYSMFVYPSHFTGSLWPVVLVQSLLVALLLRIVLRAVFEIYSRLGFLMVIGLLSVLTSLPWYTGFLMPDIFTPVLVLGLFLLAFCPERLSRWELVFVVGLTLLAAVAHYSNVPIAVGLILAGIIFHAALGNRSSNGVPHLMLPGGLIAASVIAIVLSNYLTLGLITYSAGGYAFELARLQADGPAVEYLRETCPTRSYKLCGFLSRMPMKVWEFLWYPDGPTHTIGWLQERQEGSEIIRGTIERYPLWILRDAIRNTVEQVAAIKTGGGLISYADSKYPTADVKTYYPDDFAAYLNSRQSHGEFANLEAVNRAHIGVVIFSLIYCALIAVLLARDEHWLPVELMVTIVLAIFLNSFVSGSLSLPEDRYGSRIIWLVPLAAIASWRQVLGLVKTK